jgi:hypothetical protein
MTISYGQTNIDISNTHLVSMADSTGWGCRIVEASRHSFREKYPYTGVM